MSIHEMSCQSYLLLLILLILLGQFPIWLDRRKRKGSQKILTICDITYTWKLKYDINKHETETGSHRDGCCGCQGEGREGEGILGNQEAGAQAHGEAPLGRCSTRSQGPTRACLLEPGWEGRQSLIPAGHLHGPARASLVSFYLPSSPGWRDGIPILWMRGVRLRDLTFPRSQSRWVGEAYADTHLSACCQEPRHSQSPTARAGGLCGYVSVSERECTWV